MAGINNLYVHSKMSLLEKAIQGKIPIYFVLAHGKDYSKRAQAVSSVPRNKTLILPVSLGEHLTYEAAHELVKRFSSREKLSKFLGTLPSRFRVLNYRDQFSDTILKFHDPNFWTGIQRLPYKKFELGIDKRVHSVKDTHMKGTSPTISPRKKVSTFLNELPEEEEALYIIASCRGVKSVPSNKVGVTTTITAQRTSAQIKKLESAKREAERKSKKRYTPPSGATQKNPKKRKVEPSRKRKRTPSESSRKKQKTRESPVGSLTKKMKSLKI